MRHRAAKLLATALVVYLAAHGPVLLSQSATTPAPTGLIVGRVVDATGGTPVSSVIVGLAGPSLPRSINVLTDGQGRFLFRNVPKGSFTLRATIGGNGYAPSGFMIAGAGSQIGPYLNGGFGQRRPGGQLQQIDIDDGARISDVVIRLWKGASIDGTVVDEAGEPLVNVVVAAARRSTDGRLLNGPSTRTDDRGAYHFGTLVPGEYVVLVPHVQAATPAATVETLVAPPDRLMDARLANSLGAGFAGGIRVGSSAVSTTTVLNTNAIAPSPRGDALHIYQTTYAPSATSLDQALSVTVQPGEERMGVNISMQPVRAFAVSGTLTDDAGPVPQFGVRLMPREAEDGSSVMDVAATSTDARGRFTFPLVPPGSYRVIAQRITTTLFTDGPEAAVQPARIADQGGTSAQQEIAVGDSDVSDIALQLKSGVQVSGRVEFRGSGKRPSADQLRQFSVYIGTTQNPSRLYFNPTRGGRMAGTGEFVIRDVQPGRYLTYATDISGWSVLAVTLGGRPMAERAFTVETTDVAGLLVELTDQPAEIRGTVQSRAGAPDPDASVLIFSTDRARWRDARNAFRTFRAVRVSKAGAFTVPTVLPGEYFIVAIPDEAAADFPDETFLTGVASQARTVRVAVGEKPTVSLTTSQPPPARRVSLASSQTEFVLPSEPTAHGPFVPGAPDDDLAQAGPVRVVLSGAVVTDETPARPLRHAIVTVSGAEIVGSRQAVTDDEGRFAFPDLPPGRYSLVAEKAGYVKTFHGSNRPGRPPGTPVAVLAGEAARNVVIRVLRGAVIAGTIRDPFGMPVASSQVTVKQPIIINGQRRMIDVPNLLVPNATTDDRGRYRIYGLPPGEYTVHSAGGSASYMGVRETNAVDVEAALREMKGAGLAASANPPPEARQVSMHAGYLPGVADVASAQLVTLGAGEERTGADILTRLVRSLRVQGVTVGPNGAPMTNVGVAIVNVGDGTLWGSPGLVRPGTDGRFVVPSLTPGHYALIGRAGENGADEVAPMLYSGEVEFVLNDQDVSGIVLQFAPGVTVSGRIVPPANARPGDLARVRLNIRAADARGAFAPAPPPATVQANGTYRFEGVGPGKYRVAGALPAGWSLRSAIVNGKDTLDAPLEVKARQPVSDLVLTMTTRPAELVGALSDAAGRPVSDYSMLVFSTDKSLWDVPRRISGAVRLSSDGRYRISGLPPGEYYVTAITDFDPLQLSDASFLESLIPPSAKVTIGEGERKEFNLKIGG